MSASISLYQYLLENRQVTTRQAKTLFKVANVADLVYRLRNAGVSVYTNRYTTSRGAKTFSYRLGTPSAKFLSNMQSRHVARARQALYSQAVGA